MNEILSNVRADTEVIVTGTSGSGRRHVRLRAVVATMSRNDAEWAIKVWPLDTKSDGSEIEGGKIWFVASNIEAIEVVEE